jgi:hypothetical protein
MPMDVPLAITVADPPYEGAGESDVSVVVHLSIAIRCFSGGTKVALSTSRGKVGEAGPGETAAIFIGPEGISNEELSGDVELILPEARVARLDARLGDQVATRSTARFAGRPRGAAASSPRPISTTRRSPTERSPTP